MKKLSIKIYLLATAAIVTLLGGCKKIDDLVIFRDPLQMDAEMWEQEAAVQYLLNDTYQFIMPQFPYEYLGNNYLLHLASDENYFSANESLGKKLFNFSGYLNSDECKYVGTKYAGANYGENRYFDVTKCNLAIKKLPLSKTISNEGKRKMLGQFYALRGMLYFGLTKVYGGMPLVLEPQSPTELKLEGRQKAHVMFEQILKDYDSAMVNLEGVTWLDQNERGKLTKLAVMCLKAQALKWWASPLFNPNNDAARWQTAFTAIEEAYNEALKANRQLIPEYSKIFTIEGTAQTEAIIVRSYSPTQPKKFQQVELRSRPASEGGSPHECYNPSKQMLDAYTMKDGRTINDTNTNTSYVYDDVVFWANRDPRFDATIVFNGSVWPLSGKAGRKQWTYSQARYDGIAESNKPLYVKRFSNSAMAKGSVAAAGDLGGNGYDWIEYRLAELMLDYAEAANETGQTAIAKNMVRAIRKRAGIVEGNFDYGLSLADDKDKMRDLILNERMVEFAFEGKRNDDLRRTRRMHLLQGVLGQMSQMTAVSGTMLTELEKKVGANSLGIDPNTLCRDTIDMYNRTTVQKYFAYPYSVRIPNGNGSFNMPQSYYFFPLSNQFLLSSPLLAQTIGWTGGTFDPLSE